MKATYIKTRLPSIVNVSRIVTIHDYEFGSEFSFAGESHDFWELVYIDDGCVEICRDGERLALSAGDIILHSPNEFHSVRALNSSPRFFVISFVCHSPALQCLYRYHTSTGSSIRPFLTAIIAEAEKTFIIPKNDTDLKVLERREDAPLGAEQLIKTYLEQLLIFLIRNAARKGAHGVFATKASMETHLVGAVKNIIEEHVEEPFRVELLCRELGYSRSYLSRIFHAETGDTLARFALARKIERAKRMILDGALNFAQISDRLAFDNPQYFSRVFKRITGETPTQFKRSVHR